METSSRGAARSPPIWSEAASSAGLWSASRTAGCRSGKIPTMAPPPQFSPSHPSASPSHRQGLGRDKGGGVLQLLEEGLCLFSEGARRAWGPENTFMWQRQGAEPAVSHPGCPPKWQQWGQPLSRPDFRPHLTGWHRQVIPQLPPASVGGLLGVEGEGAETVCPICATIPPKQLRRRATVAPLPGHLPQWPPQGAVHSRSSAQGSWRGPHCANCQHPTSSYPDDHFLRAAAG